MLEAKPTDVEHKSTARFLIFKTISRTQSEFCSSIKFLVNSALNRTDIEVKSTEIEAISMDKDVPNLNQMIKYCSFARSEQYLKQNPWTLNRNRANLGPNLRLRVHSSFQKAQVTSRTLLKAKSRDIVGKEHSSMPMDN